MITPFSPLTAGQSHMEMPTYASSRPRARSARRAGIHWPHDRQERPGPRLGALWDRHREP
jgi:hypothetical protein